MWNRRNAVLGLLLAGVATWLILQQPFGRQLESLPAIALPADNPDIYIEGLTSTRLNNAGELVLTTEAKTLAVYEQDNISLFQQPIVELYRQQTARWQIRSSEGKLLRGDDIEFINQVEVIQLDATPPIRIYTDYLKVTDDGQRISTDRPVEILKGKQITNAVGMEVKLDTIEPLIKLLSDVSFRYEPA